MTGRDEQILYNVFQIASMVLAIMITIWRWWKIIVKWRTLCTKYKAHVKLDIESLP